MDEVNGIMQAGKEMTKFLTGHIERFAAAFIKETGLDPTKVKMVQKYSGNMMEAKIWFEPFPENSDIEHYRVRAENAEARAERAEKIVAFYRERAELLDSDIEDEGECNVD